MEKKTENILAVLAATIFAAGAAYGLIRATIAIVNDDGPTAYVGCFVAIFFGLLVADVATTHLKDRLRNCRYW